ncbi:MAG: hypothetical protein Greene07144_572 [Parcubacteria group bacterium Greene0714_4]|nr:MAG: hypothetical protein Greene07144_572 [Parcubacteria group bacterium Greene0714_4]
MYESNNDYDFIEERTVPVKHTSHNCVRLVDIARRLAAIVLIVFVKILLIFSVMDYSLGVWREAGPLGSLAGECKKLKNEAARGILIVSASVDAHAIGNFSEVVAYVTAFPSIV